MVAPLLIPIAAQIARVVATKGIRAAIKKFGKDVVKKNADKVPQSEGTRSFVLSLHLHCLIC